MKTLPNRTSSLPLIRHGGWLPLIVCLFSVTFTGLTGLKAQSVLDPSYDPTVGQSSEGSDQTFVWSLAVMPGKKMLVGGHYSTLGKGSKAAYHGGLARLTDTGAAEDGRYYAAYPFDPDATNLPSYDSSDAFIWSVFVSADHDTLVSGNYNSIGGERRQWMGRITNKLGSAVYYNAPPRLEWPPGEPRVFPNGGLILPNGDPIFYGYWWKSDGQEIRSLIMQTGTFGDYTTDSGFDPDILSAGDPESMPLIQTVLRQNDGKLLVAGFFTSVAGQPRTSLVRLNANASRDDSFSYAGAVGTPGAMTLQPDGRILVASGSVSRLLANGSIDPSFVSAATDGIVRSMVLRADGKVIIGGYFENITASNGVFARNGVAMLTSTGAVDTAFDPNVEASSYLGVTVPTPRVTALAIQADGKVVIGGSFSKVSGITRKALARFTADVPAVDDLVVAADRTSIIWTRGGSAPELVGVQFQLSTNGGKTYTTLAAPTYTGTGWSLTGLSLPTGSGVYVRATGNTISGDYSGSAGLIEKIANPIAVFTDQPDGQVVPEGAMVSFQVVARSSLAITSYQWRRNGVNLTDGPNISGATTDTLQITAAMLADGGTYTVLVKTAAGSATSAGALLKVVIPPLITTEPVDLIVGKGKTAKFTVVASGTTPTYLWTGPFPPNATGKTGPTLSFTNAQLSHEGGYQVTVSNLAGVDTSVIANLNVVELATVAAPAHVMAALGTSPVLSAVVTSEVPPLAHQWLRNNVAVSGGTSATLTLSNIQLANAGAYSLKATNQAGSTTGSQGQVGVVDTTNQKVQVQPENGKAVFTAAAAGNSLTYAWRRLSAPMDVIAHDGVKYFLSSGGKVLTVKSLQLGDADDYVCDVTGPGGALTTAIEHLYVTTGKPVLAAGQITFTENAMVGSPFSKQINDDGNINTKPASYTMTISPALGGLTISKTGLISGRPTKAGTFTVTVKGVNSFGSSVVPVTGTLIVEPVPANAVGKFVALIERKSPLNKNLGGRLDLTTTSAGSYSGKVTLGASVYSFSGGKLGITTDGDADTGTFDNPTNVISVPRKGTTPLTLSFDLNLANNTIMGSITDGVNPAADLDGWRLVWGTPGYTKVDAASNFLGRFNFTYQTPAEVAPNQNWPHGVSHGTLSVPSSGSFTVAGTMADNTAFSTAAFLGPQGQFMVFKTLYSNKGSVLGNHQIAATAAGTVTDYLNPAQASWLRDNQAPTVTYSYPLGFGPLTLTVDGSRYDSPIPSAENALGSSVTTVDTELDFEDGGLAVDNPDAQFILNALHKSTITPNPHSISLTVDKATGLFSGTFSVTDDIDPGAAVKNIKRPGKFSGRILRTTGGQGTGYGFFTLQELPVFPSTSLTTRPVLSGKVTLKNM